MLSSTILKLADPYDYQTAMGRGTAADLKTVVTSPGVYQSELALMELHQLGLQHGWTSLPRIVRGASKKNLCAIDFLTADNKAHVTFNGTEAPESHIVFFCPGAEHVVSASAGLSWCGISLSPETLGLASQALAGYEITAPQATQLIRTPPPLMARLRDLHRAATQLAATVPDILTHPEVARAIEQELVRAMVACLVNFETMGSSNRSRQVIMRRFQEVIEANQGEPLYLTDICVAIGVTDRTLRNACSEYLGMSPHRYLGLRRMNLVRRALILASPSATTVTATANDYGFGELGRFAVAYRAMYGESPSATLRRTPNQERRVAHRR